MMISRSRLYSSEASANSRPAVQSGNVQLPKLPESMKRLFYELKQLSCWGKCASDLCGLELNKITVPERTWCRDGPKKPMHPRLRVCGIFRAANQWGLPIQAPARAASRANAMSWRKYP
eukprot:743968-Amphidinium_carterae.1